MKQRHVVRKNYHPVLGHIHEVYDTHARRVRSIITGEYSLERARQKAQELDQDAEDEAERDVSR